MGPVYAQPVTFEPQPLPMESGGLDSLYPQFDFNNIDSEEQLIQQWVVMEETGNNAGNESTMDPDMAASAWANLSGMSTPL